jgi:hypothetical protein
MLFGRHYVSPLPTWDDIPITKVADNYIQFGNSALSNPYWEGELDRFTGELTIFHRAFADTEKYSYSASQRSHSSKSETVLHMAWTYIPGSGKISLEGVEFGLTNGAETRRCFISQQEIDRWAAHVGKIDQNIAFELFVKHADEICAAASRALDTEPNAELTIITADDR